MRDAHHSRAPPRGAWSQRIVSFLVFLQRSNDRHRPDSRIDCVFPRKKHAMTPGNIGFPHTSGLCVGTFRTRFRGARRFM
jgi:hypothetical protein